MPADQIYPQYRGTESKGTDGMDFDGFFRAHRRTLERFIRTRIGGLDDAEDIASEVMCQLVAYCTEHPEPPSSRHRALMFKIARNRIVDYYERRKEQLRDVPMDDAPPIVASGDIAATIDADDALREVRAALATLREEYREAITLHAIVGLTTREMGELMGKPGAHVRVLLFRARRSLRKALRAQHPEQYGAAEVDEQGD